MENIYIVKNPRNVKKVLIGLLGKSDLDILIITDELADKNLRIINAIIEEFEFPVIITVPTLGSEKTFETDTITNLIRRKIGVE